ncbi:MAG: response regulator [Terriglobia bacterium]
MALKLLIVDDDPDVLRVLKEMLQALSYEVLALTSGQEAAERLDRQKFDGVFLDARMPGMDGFALVRHIRASSTNSSAPVIMLTGYDDVETMRAGFKAGITFFLGKPPDLSRLSGLLRSFHAAMLREKRSYIRLPLRNVVTCTKGEHRFTSTSLNISEGGILLETSGGLDLGDDVNLTFSLPQSSGMLNPRGVVVRKGAPDKIAVHFSDLSSEDRKAIQDYIAGRVKE